MSEPAVDLQTLEQATERTRQLQVALDTRITIEQAKGILIERYGLTPDQAFQLLRTTARNDRRNLHTLAEEIVEKQETPGALIQSLARCGYAQTAHEHQLSRMTGIAGQLRKARMQQARHQETERRRR